MWVVNFTPREWTPAPIRHKTVWATQPVWTSWRRNKCLPLSGILTPVSPIRVPNHRTDCATPAPGYIPKRTVYVNLDLTNVISRIRQTCLFAHHVQKFHALCSTEHTSMSKQHCTKYHRHECRHISDTKGHGPQYVMLTRQNYARPPIWYYWWHKIKT
jgi:hypothetical protein